MRKAMTLQPCENRRVKKAVTKNGTFPKFAEDVNIEEIGMSDECKNYTGAELASLVREAGIAAFKELVLANSQSGEQCPEKDLKIYSRHFQKAFSNTKPSVPAKDRMKYEKIKEEHYPRGF